MGTEPGASPDRKIQGGALAQKIERLSLLRAKPPHRVLGWHIVDEESRDADGLTELGALQLDNAVILGAQKYREYLVSSDRSSMGGEADATVVSAMVAVRRYIEG